MSDKKAKKRWKNKKATGLDEKQSSPTISNDVIGDIPMADGVEAKKSSPSSGDMTTKQQQSQNGNVGSRFVYNSPLRSKSSGAFSSFGSPRSAMLQQHPPPLPLPDSPTDMSKSVNNYTVRAQIESPPEAKIKSWPTSPEHRTSASVLSSFKGGGGVVTAVNGGIQEDTSGAINGVDSSASAKQIDNEEPVSSATEANGGVRNVNGSKIPRRPSLNKSRSDEALAATRVKKSPPSRLMADPAGPKLNINVKDSSEMIVGGGSVKTSDKGTVCVLRPSKDTDISEKEPSSSVVGEDKTSPRYHSGDDNSSSQLSPRDARRKATSNSGEHSPGCQSVASITSQATIMTTSTGLPLDGNQKAVSGGRDWNTILLPELESTLRVQNPAISSYFNFTQIAIIYFDPELIIEQGARWCSG